MSAEQEAARPATVYITSYVTSVDAQHVWTDAKGVTHGSFSIGASSIVCHDPGQARQLAAALSGMAEKMEQRQLEHAEIAAAYRRPGVPA